MQSKDNPCSMSDCTFFSILNSPLLLQKRDTHIIMLHIQLSPWKHLVPPPATVWYGSTSLTRGPWHSWKLLVGFRILVCQSLIICKKKKSSWIQKPSFWKRWVLFSWDKGGTHDSMLLVWMSSVLMKLVFFNVNVQTPVLIGWLIYYAKINKSLPSQNGKGGIKRRLDFTTQNMNNGSNYYELCKGS